MFAYPPRLGPGRPVGLRPARLHAADDVREIYWDPNATSKYNRSRAPTSIRTPGKRYSIGADPEPALRTIPVARWPRLLRARERAAHARTRALSRRRPIARIYLLRARPRLARLRPRQGAARHRRCSASSPARSPRSGAWADPHLPRQPVHQLRLRRDGSMVGVIAIGLYLEHGWSYWVVLPRRWSSAPGRRRADRVPRHPPLQQLHAPGAHRRAASVWPSCSAASSCSARRRSASSR